MPWPTTTSKDGASSGRVGRAPNSHPGTTLTDATDLVPWPTPSARDHKGDGREAGPLDYNSRPLNEVARTVTPWTTPKPSDLATGHESRTMDPVRRNLTDQALLATWATPQAMETGRTPEQHMAMRSMMEGGERRTATALSVQTHGLEPTPSSAATANGASYRLNPNFSLWLMGLPVGWLELRALGNACVPLQAYVPASALFEVMSA